jgi:hypothetical protein
LQKTAEKLLTPGDRRYQITISISKIKNGCASMRANTVEKNKEDFHVSKVHTSYKHINKLKVF